MKSGAEEMIEVLNEMRTEVEANKCKLGDAGMRAMAMALRTLYRSKMPKKYSREAAANAIGVSTRHFARLASDAGVKPHRDGFKNIYYTEEDIELISHKR